MDDFCRLCAIPKQREEFKCKIDDQHFDIEQKLVTCCNWNSYRSHHNLPQNVCISCFLQLEQCWYFRETVARAQEKLCNLMQIDIDLKAMDDIQVKEENLADETVEVAPIEVSTLKLENDYENYTNYHESGDDNDIDKKYSYDVDDDVGGGGGSSLRNVESTDDVNKNTKTKRKITKRKEKEVEKEKANVKRKNGTPKMKKSANNDIEFDIKTLLSREDVNENGTIKPEKICAQNFCNWTTITSRCYKCNKDFDTNSDLWIHFTSTHSNEKIKFICPICPDEMLFLSGRYYRSHIAKTHFPHLVYW